MVQIFLSNNLERTLSKTIEMLRFNAATGSMKCGFLFIGHAKTLSFVRSESQEFCMFSLHSVEIHNKFPMGRPVSGLARLFRCRSARTLATLLVADCPLTNSRGQICKMIVTLHAYISQHHWKQWIDIKLLFIANDIWLVEFILSGALTNQDLSRITNSEGLWQRTG